MTGDSSAQSSVTQGFIGALVIFLLIMAACFGYLKPALVTTRQMTAAANDAVITINVQMNDINAHKARDAEDRGKFEALKKQGFVGPQDRLNAARILESLRVKHRISGLEYQIDPVETLSLLRQPENTGEMISVSEISMSMLGFTDGDIRDFINAVARDLPGHVSITEVELEKLSAPDDALLAQIRSGGGKELVRGSLKLLWQAVHINQEDSGQSQ